MFGGIDLRRRGTAIAVTLMMIFASVTAIAAPQTAGQLDVNGINAAAQVSGSDGISGIAMLEQIFGTIVHDPLSGSANGANDSSQLLGAIFGVLNMGLLAIGSIFLTYGLMVGIVQTAHDGEFLGQRLSTIWVPIRLTTGMVSLVPIFKGWSLAQLMLLWFSVMGVGMANLATNAITGKLLSGSGLTYAGGSSGNSDFVKNLFQMHVCIDALNMADDEQMGQPIGTSGVWHESVNGQTYYYGSSWSNSCGAIMVPTGKYASNAVSAYTALDRNLAQKAAIFVRSLSNTSTGVIFDPAWLDDATRSYSMALKKKSVSVDVSSDRMGNVAARLQQEGFVGLGSYYSTLARAGHDEAVAAAVKATIAKSPVMPSEISGQQGDYYKRAMMVIGARMKTQSVATSGTGANVTGGDENAIIQKLASKVSESETCSFTAFGGILKCIYASHSSNGVTLSPGSSLLVMKETGDWLERFGLVGLTVIFAIEGVADGAENAVESTPIVGKWIGIATSGGKAILMGFADIAKLLLETTTFFGMMLSNYLPLLPYIAWLGGLISWLTVVMEGVVGAPLWAFAHLDTDGEGMGQRSQQGYLFLFNVLFRPILMVIGFVLAGIVMEVVGTFFFLTYPMAVGDAGTIGGFYDLIGFVVAVAVFFTTSVMIVTTSVNLIHYIPDTVLAWIGTSTNSSSAGSRMSGDFGQGSAAVTAYSQGALSGARQNRNARLQKDISRRYGAPQMGGPGLTANKPNKSKLLEDVVGG